MAFAADFFPAAFFRAGAGFFVAADFAAARFAAHIFFVAAMIAALPAALSFRFGFGAFAEAGACGSDSPFILAHRSFWARAILRRTARLRFRRFGFVGSGVVTV
jgi:hypothetical protein